MKKKAIIGSAAAGALAGVALVVFTRGGDKVVSRVRPPPDDADGHDPLGLETAKERAAHVDVQRRVADLAERTAPQVVAEIPTLSRVELRSLRSHEQANKNRVSVLRAIDRALA